MSTAPFVSLVDRIPPSNLEAEMALLGSVLVDKEMMAVVSEIVRPSDFYASMHEAIYLALLALYETGKPLDKVALAEELRSYGMLDKVGGLAYLSSLMKTVPTAASAEYYAKIVREKAALRSLIHVGTRITQLGYESEHDVPAALDESRVLVQAIEVCAPRRPITWDAAHSWPVLRDEALRGIGGEYVGLLAPHTEADLSAILVHFLTTYGAAIGPSAHVLVEATRHPARLNALIVGDTARGRKGTAKDRVQHLFRLADEEWLDAALVSGLASGEGLIERVRDRDDDGDVEHEPVERRVIVIEPEFGRVLAAASRDGSTLCAIIRDAWDTGRLANMTRKAPQIARGAHVCFLGDITSEELRVMLSTTQIANGFANRFLFVAARRRQRLPHGGSLGDAEVAPIARLLRERIDSGRRTGQVRRTPAGDAWWEQWYAAVPDEPGLIGAVTARAEAQVLRLSLIYALLDGETAIDVPHLEAARAMWDYAHASARHIFGSALGDPIAERLLDAVRDAYPAGLDGVAQDRATGGRRTRAARELLVAQGLASLDRVPADRGGRASVVLYAVPPTCGTPDNADIAPADAAKSARSAKSATPYDDDKVREHEHEHDITRSHTMVDNDARGDDLTW